MARFVRAMTGIALLFLPMTALAADPAPAGDRSSTDPVSGEKVVCRPIQQTGSRMSKRVCRTRAEWASIDAQNAQASSNWRDQAGRRNAGGN